MSPSTVLAVDEPRLGYHREAFSPEEAAILSRFFTNVDRPVFAIVNLPEVVKGALFARYSRSPKSVRRLFLDEFVQQPELGVAAIARRLQEEDGALGTKRAEDLYERVFNEYGDDSVAQLGGVHLACEQSSNLLTKVLERGRLAAYLEQSTRYMLYDQKLGDGYRYLIPPEVAGGSLAEDYRRTMDGLFETYSELAGRLIAHYEARFPKAPGDSNFVWRSTIRAKACDTARGLLPAATLSNVGIYASGQAYETLLLRMRAHPLAEVRGYAHLILEELRRVIPAFMKRVDRPDRGGAWSAYLAETASRTEELARRVEDEPQQRPEVTLVEWDPEAELKVVAAALYPHSNLPDDQLLEVARRMSAEERAAVMAACVGQRGNRRHKPGRAMERTFYRFDILCDYGIFRDLQRHRLLTLDWQRLGTSHGYVLPPAVGEIEAQERWRHAMERAADLHDRVAERLGGEVAQYVVPFAYRIRFSMQLNARAAFHLIELRTQQSGHSGYRRVCSEMHRLIRDRAGHHLIADAMSFVDHHDYELERLEAERRAAARREAMSST
ncbi:MAG: FAD-dependent thymidylate synthase [Actinomycetota bacterium]|nr:FAD-dependent thymidylate synthase [Actinomycetota bacterium]